MAGMFSSAPGARNISSKTSVINPADNAILQDLFRYHYLIAAQVCRLRYSAGSLTLVQARLKRLSDLGYCQRLFLQRASQHGSAPSVYRLARRGLTFLAAQGFDTSGRYRPSERQRSLLHLSHTLSVNDFLISLELLCRRHPPLILDTLRHEGDLKRHPSYVQYREGRKVAVIPDGWVDLHLGAEQVCLALELDQSGSVEQKRWRQRVGHLLLWTDGSYQKQFETTSLTIAVLALRGEKRRGELLRWTEAELSALGKEAQADLFRFTSLDPRVVSPEELFLLPCWCRPFEAQHPLPLLEGVA